MTNEELRQLFEDDDMDFLQVSDAHNAEPAYSHSELVDMLVKHGHATETPSGKFITLVKLFSAKRK